MSVDNGTQRRLVIAGVFEGLAGESDGLLAIIPNRKGRRARYIRAGELDGDAVHLTFVGENPPFVTYRYGGPA